MRVPFARSNTIALVQLLVAETVPPGSSTRNRTADLLVKLKNIGLLGTDVGMLDAVDEEIWFE